MKILLAEQLGCLFVAFFGREALFAAKSPVALLKCVGNSTFCRKGQCPRTRFDRSL